LERKIETSEAGGDLSAEALPTRRTFLARAAVWAAGGGAAAGILGGLAWGTRGLWLPGHVSGSEVNEAALMLLAHPSFSGSLFSSQVLGEAKLVLYDLDKRELLFEIPVMQPSQQKALLGRFLADPSAVQMIGNDGEAAVCRTAAENFRVNPDAVLRFPYARAEYSITLRELARYLKNVPLYGGKLEVVVGRDDYSGRPICMANHGALVAKPGEPSLARLAQALAGGSESREERIQSLVDFVTAEVAYDHEEADLSVETLKRPSEVLMSGRSDCSGKNILLASLLEQLGEDYLLVYTQNHISVAVRQGNFDVRRGHTFAFDGSAWILVEATAPGFVIGGSQVDYPGGAPQLKFLQRPREKNAVIDARTGARMPTGTGL